MNIVVKHMTKNDCYKAGKKITPKGVMIHATATPGLMAADWYSRWNKPGINKCVHAFVDNRGIYQYLPWNHRGWHAGGAANNTHISIELCEPAGHKYSGSKMLNYDVKKNQKYFDAVWENAITLTVLLCREFGLTEKNVIDHSEGSRQGIASSSADVGHWFPKHGKSMDAFRAEVKKRLGGGSELRYGKTLRRGDKGSEVKRLQQDLIDLGYGSYMKPYGADGSFGAATENAVKAFQKANKLAVDGIVGPATQKKIEELLKAKSSKPASDYKKLYEDMKKKYESAISKLNQIKKIVG